MQKASLSTASRSDVETPSKAWTLIVAGYSTTAVALVVFLTINGSSVSTAATIATAVLITIGLLLSVAGMLGLRRSLGPIKSIARYGFAMQAFGLLGLFFGVVPLVVSSSPSGYFISAVFIITSGVSAVAGAVILRRYFTSAITLNNGGAVYLIFGTALIFSGVGLIVGSNVAFEYWIPQVENTFLVDLGAMISACGCVLAAYSFFVLHNRDELDECANNKINEASSTHL